MDNDQLTHYRWVGIQSVRGEMWSVRWENFVGGMRENFVNEMGGNVVGERGEKVVELCAKIYSIREFQLVTEGADKASTPWV